MASARGYRAAKNERLERVYKRIYNIVKDRDLRPGTTLAGIAAIEGFSSLY